MVIIQKQVVLANLLSLAFLLKTAKWICMFLLTVLIIKLKEWKLIDMNVYFFYTCKLHLHIINRSVNWLWCKEKILDISLYLINETPNPCNQKSNAFIIYGSIIYTRTNNKLLISFLNVMNYDYGLIGYNRASSKWKLCTSKKSAIFFNIYSDPCLVQYVYGYIEKTGMQQSFVESRARFLINPSNFWPQLTNLIISNL